MAQNQSKASTQQHLDVEDITEDLVILNSGSVAMVLSTTAVNFDILSEAEQDATIYAYAAFLNSLSFPLQILIRSKKADITAYYQHLEKSMLEQPNPDLKMQIQKYMEFIKSTVQQKTILDKQFYFVITFSQLELGVRGLAPKPKSQSTNKAQLIKDAKVNLFPRRDHIIKQAARLGLVANQLSTKDLIGLFYDIYNPAPTGTQRIILDTASYSAPLVKPAVESPEPQTQTANSQNQPPAAPIVPAQAAYENTQPPAPPPSTTQSQQAALLDLQQAASQAAGFIKDRQQAHQQAPQQQANNGQPINPSTHSINSGQARSG